MKLLRVAAATLNQTPLDWDHNEANVLGAIAAARAAGVGLLCLPELCLTGYGCEDAFQSPGVHEQALRSLGRAVEATEGVVAAVGLPLRHQGAVFDVCALAADGRLLGFVAKRALAGDGIHYEPRWFKPWPRGQRSHVEILGSEVPIGDLVFDVGGIRIGFEICEDAWTAVRPGAELASEAVDVILNPSASHFAFGKHEIRRRLVLEGSRAFGVTYVYANLLGNEAGRAIYDGDALIATGGAIVAEARRFGYGDRALLTAVVDVEVTRLRRAALDSFQPAVAGEPAVGAAFAWPRVELPALGQGAGEVSSGADTREEELARAIPLALFDYLRKARAGGFVLSLSGGADSAAIACFVRLMVAFAARELGLEGLRRRLAHVPGLEGAADERAVVGALLTTAYQATRNSGEVTRAAARAVAEAVGARHLELDVDGLVEGYVSTIERAIGRRLEWSRDDIALQNIQARVRAPSVWLLANLENKLLLATSNRSEAAVGYATMDGDTSGSVSPLAGVDKAFLLRWLAWLEATGPEGVGPIPALAAVTSQAPTAELRPPSARQTDEQDLMPYAVLDAIERAAIRDKRTPLDVWRLLRSEAPERSPRELLVWVERFFRLWSRNQWKRERYAPSFHVDDESLDPKTWCRFPILSGGFARELAELRAEAERELGGAASPR
ncbi:MAG: NAD(+) synthase [Polyangiaceae bacterium]|nr:NAD(+) synthase [Polyangiaceae bacterium]